MRAAQASASSSDILRTVAATAVSPRSGLTEVIRLQSNSKSPRNALGISDAGMSNK